LWLTADINVKFKKFKLSILPDKVHPHAIDVREENKDQTVADGVTGHFKMRGNNVNRVQ